MARLNLQSAAPGMMAFIISLTTSLFFYYLPSGAEQSSSRAASSHWAGPVDDLKKAAGPVAAVLVDFTELGTDEAQSELDRFPFKKYQYDTSGRIIKQLQYVRRGEEGSTQSYVYDDKGRLLKENHHSGIDGTIHLLTAFTYDEQGRPAEAVGYGSEDDSVLSKEIYRHDPDKNYTEVEEYWGEVLRTKIGYYRDAKGRVAEQHYLSTMYQGKGILGYAGKTVYTYNEKGDVVLALRYDAGDNLEEKEDIGYEYDSYGNWVKRVGMTEYPDTDPPRRPTKDVTYRTITYNR